jgi:hypothetical protein
MMNPFWLLRSRPPRLSKHTLTTSSRGSTYTGHDEPVKISKILDEYETKTGVNIPVHVDAASGGFMAPFTYAKAGDPKWNVVTLNCGRLRTILIPRAKNFEYYLQDTSSA